MLPIIPFLSIMIAGGLLAALRNGYFLKITAVTVFIAAIVHNVLMANMVLSYIQPAKVVLGGQSREQYLGQKLFYYRGVSAANALLGQNTRVLYFGETRGYYYNGDHYTPSFHDINPLIETANLVDSAGSLAQQLAKQGFTHLFVAHFDVKRLGWEDRFTANGLAVWKSFQKTYLKSLYADQYCELYAITKS